MKIVVDMQGVQTDSRHRGIGRYCFGLTRSLIEFGDGTHDVSLLFNAALDGIDEAVDALDDAEGNAKRRAFGPIRNTSSDNRVNDARRAAAERVLTQALDAVDADVVWLSSVVEGLADDALVPHAPPRAFTVATLYDLIPLHDPEYLGHAGPRDWYMGRLDVLKRCDMLLAISEWVRRDAIERLGIEPERIVAIGAGVEPRFAPPAPGTDNKAWIHARFGIRRPFVMYNGGFDKRKNVLALIEAYASLPLGLRASHTLAIVGRIPPLFSERLAETMAATGLASDEVVFTGFVSDSDLVRIYQSCALFVFPSEREGFGLPPLEAMACGAPTLVNNATSLPEVVGDPEALFDAGRPGVMAGRMAAVLTDAGLAKRLRDSGLTRAAHFSWEAVAERATMAIASCLACHGRQEGRVSNDDMPPLPIYRIDASNVESTLPVLRQWPGSVSWSGELPGVGPSLPADRFRVGGYAGLTIASSPTDWLSLLHDEATGVVLSSEKAPAALPAHFAALQRAHPLGRLRLLEQEIAASLAPALSDDDLARVADALVRATPGRHVRWLVDVTHIDARDLGTGVHRVVRSILREWLVKPPSDVRIEPIAFRDGRFHHAHEYACQLMGVDMPSDLPGDLVAVTGNELYVGLDWTMESLPSSAPLLRTWRRAGVGMHFIVYDLLPLTMPNAFHAQSRDSFLKWMTAITALGDVLHCISRSTADDVASWLTENTAGRKPVITSFALGAEGGITRAESPLEPTLEAAMSASPSLLMVGTVEPRKGHAQVLEAAELLWESGADFILVVVGRRGWLVKELTERLQQHIENGKRLFWLDEADDGTLEAVYRRSTALLAASLGEGYGLPLIEAAQRGKPIIARALPVFREVAGDYPSYFNTEAPSGLATHIARWLVDRPRPAAPLPWRTWEESAASLRDAILGGGRIETRPGDLSA